MARGNGTVVRKVEAHGFCIEIRLQKQNHGMAFVAVFPDGVRIESPDGTKIEDAVHAEIMRRVESLTWTRCIDVEPIRCFEGPGIGGLRIKVIDLAQRSDGVMMVRSVVPFSRGDGLEHVGLPERSGMWESIDVLPCHTRERVLLLYSEKVYRELGVINAGFLALSKRVRQLLREPNVGDILETVSHQFALMDEKSGDGD